MSNSEKLDSCKKEIRSVLIPCQRGCSLAEFHREYKNLIGTRLPSANFGYKTDIDFLRSMPDVVRITVNRRGDYHLEAVADENSKHIQKMVSRQKPSKLKGAPPPRYNSRPARTFVLPPRFMPEVRSTPEPKLPQKTITKEIKLPPTEPLSIRTQSEAKLSPKEEVVILVQKHKNRLALDDLLVEYQRMYNKHLSLSTYGLSSIQECVECIPELKIVRKNNVDFIVPDNGVQNSPEEASDRIPTPEAPSMFNSNSSRNEDYYDGNVPNSLKKKFQEVAHQHPNGIWASEFPEYFQEVTSDSLDFNGLGYRCLADLIDDVPDIFIRKTVAGSRKDYIIYPAKAEVDGSVFVDYIILNFRKILEGYPEGIKIKDILHIYSINCKDMLHIEDLGFDNLETFLSSIKNSIPLRFGSIDGEKSVHLISSSTTEDFLRPPKAPEYKYETWIPFDAIIPELVKIKPLIMPVDFDFSKYVPVYVSAVAHPGRLYIQFQSEDCEQGFKKVSNEMESFYNGGLSESYMMKDVHVKEGAFCVAKWPSDNHWYRSQILSVSSANTVKVLYIDYGTIDTIPTHLLRYTKKVFTELPIQALRCRLAYVKPPHNQGKWGMQVRNRIINLCKDVPLMAKFEREPGGVYSVILCDTSGKDDVYINDVLCNEGLAEYDVPSNNENISVLPEPKIPLEYHHTLHPLQALQAQFHLKAFVTYAPSFAQNEHYLTLLQQVSMYCQTNDNMQQNIGIPLMAPIGPPGFNSIPQNVKTYFQTNSNMMGTTFPGAGTLEGNSVSSRINAITGGPVDHIIKAPVEPDPIVFSKPTENTSLGSGEPDTEIFPDDDDELFEQFCQQVTPSNIRYVKRVILGDGYKIHIIVVDSTAYVSSGDISQLIWNNTEADYLDRRLEHEEVDIPPLSLSEDGNEELFQQLRRFNVKVQKSFITLFPLESVIKILNIFGHPSVALRRRLKEEIARFDPNDPFWQDFSPDVSESEDENNNASVTDDAKIERLCLYDLMAMKESIMCKKKMLKHQNNSQSDEIHKLEHLHERVSQRIKHIRQICVEFN